MIGIFINSRKANDRERKKERTAIVMAKSTNILLSTTLFLLSILPTIHTATPVTVDRLHARLSYVKNQERVTRATFSATPSNLVPPPNTPPTLAYDTDTFIVQVSCTQGDDAYYPEQVFVRFYDTDLKKEGVYLLGRKSGMMRVDIELRKEMRKKEGFFREDVGYLVEVIVGDKNMEGFSWVVSTDMRFKGRSMEREKPGVFDFDMRVKKGVLNEFEYVVPVEEDRVMIGIVVVFTALVLMPLVGLVVVWGKLGVWPLALPKGRDLLFFVGFQACVVVQIVVLVMFWIGVKGINILETWKWLGGIMLPTLICGHRTLSNVAARDAGVDKKSDTGNTLSSPSRKSIKSKKKD